MSYRPKLLIGFEGVLATTPTDYICDHNSLNSDIVADGTTKTSIEWLIELITADIFDISIFDMKRSPAAGGIAAMKEILEENGLTLSNLAKLNFPDEMPIFDIAYGSRYVRFDGNTFPNSATITAQIKPWNR